MINLNETIIVFTKNVITNNLTQRRHYKMFENNNIIIKTHNHDLFVFSEKGFNFNKNSIAELGFLMRENGWRDDKPMKVCWLESRKKYLILDGRIRFLWALYYNIPVYFIEEKLTVSNLPIPYDSSKDRLINSDIIKNRGKNNKFPNHSTLLGYLEDNTFFCSRLSVRNAIRFYSAYSYNLYTLEILCKKFYDTKKAPLIAILAAAAGIHFNDNCMNDITKGTFYLMLCSDESTEKTINKLLAFQPIIDELNGRLEYKYFLISFALSCSNVDEKRLYKAFIKRRKSDSLSFSSLNENNIRHNLGTISDMYNRYLRENEEPIDLIKKWDIKKEISQSDIYKLHQAFVPIWVAF